MTFVLLTGMSAAALADDDLPGRVGRVADVAGTLYLSPPDRPVEWAEVGINYPVTTGDNLWVAEGGRAEIDYGGGQFRLAAETNLHVSRLDDAQLVLFVSQGRAIVRARVLDSGDAVRIDTPNTQVRLTRIGLYRIDVEPDTRTTVVEVHEGEALAAIATGWQQALPGQTVTVAGEAPADAEVRNGIAQDDFGAWSAERDRYYERSRSAEYVSPETIGAADLDQYGTWQQYPDYGPVWFPNSVAPGWVPYSDGYWTDVGAFGVTWVDAAPWGYAPFHYGRWAWVGGRWGWCPGRYTARPAWAPALVAWQGGPAWGYSTLLGSSAYAWVPLGWREAYVPPWRNCSTRCWSRFNQPYGVDTRRRPRTPPRSYANSAVPDAVTVVSAATLAGAHPVAPNRLRVPAQYAAAPALSAPPPLAAGVARSRAVPPGATIPAAASALSSRSPASRTTVPQVTIDAPPNSGVAGTAPVREPLRGSSAAPRASVPGANAYPELPPRGGAQPPAAHARGNDAPPAAQAPALREAPASGGTRIAAPGAAPPGAGGRVVAAPPVRVDTGPAPRHSTGIPVPSTMVAPAAPAARGTVAVPAAPPVAVPAQVRTPQPAPVAPAPAPRGVPVAAPRGVPVTVPQAALPSPQPPGMPPATPGHTPKPPPASNDAVRGPAVPAAPPVPAPGGLNR